MAEHSAIDRPPCMARQRTGGVKMSERNAPIPIPPGGFQSHEDEARWLADTIAMLLLGLRSAEAAEFDRMQEWRRRHGTKIARGRSPHD